MSNSIPSGSYTVRTEPQTTQILSSTGAGSPPGSISGPPVQDVLSQLLREMRGIRPGSLLNSSGRQVLPEIPKGTYHHLAEYFRNSPADESAPPQLYSQYQYTSTGVNNPHINTQNMKEVYIAATLPTSPQAQELSKGAVGNAFVQGWQDEVGKAVKVNGGLGNSEHGFLAWSKNEGFIRLRNPNLTPEQNRRMAEISLTMGMPVEEMPSKTWHATYKMPKKNEWVNKFIGSYEKEMGDFLSDPTNGVKLADGKHRFVLKMDKENGIPISYHYKKKSGFGGWVQKQMKWLGPVVNIAGAVLAPFTGGLSMVASTAINTGLKYAAYGKAALKNVGSIVGSALAPYTGGLSAAIGGMIDGGKVTWRTVVNSVTSYVGTKLGLGAAGQGALKAAGDVAGEALDTGKVTAGSIAAGLINGLPAGSFGPVPDDVMHQVLITRARAIDTGKLSAADLFFAVRPVLEHVMPSDWNASTVSGVFGTIAHAIETGEVSAADLLGVVKPLISEANLENEEVLFRGLEVFARQIDAGDFSLEQVISLILNGSRTAL